MTAQRKTKRAAARATAKAKKKSSSSSSSAAAAAAAAAAAWAAKRQAAHEKYGSPDYVAARLLRRLWDGTSGASRNAIDLGPVVDAAVALADDDGLDAVSIRAVADAVGVPAMSLYSHVAGKDELVALMQDRALRDLYDADAVPLPRGREGWRAGLTVVAETNRALFRRHPWLLRLGGPRAALGPHTVRKYEVELGPLEGTGLSDVEIDGALSLVLAHVAGTAWTRFAQVAADEGGVVDDAAWAAAARPLLAARVTAAQFPLASRVAAASGAAHGTFDEAEAKQAGGDHAFVFGLERILDGIWLLMGAPSR